jgi:hypothetical protein
MGIAAAVRCASSSLSASKTALVISSTNKGIPSRTLDDLLPDARWENLVADNADNYGVDVAL